MNYNEESLEFNLKDLLFYIFYRWKPIVIGAVITALLLGVAQAYPQYKAAASTEASEAYQKEQQTYQDQLAIYTESVNTTQEKINALQEYMDASILMNADHRNVYVAKAAYYIDTNYQIIPDSQYQNPNKTETLAWYYKNHLQDSSTYTELSKTLGIEEKYLMELVSVAEIDGETVSISVVHPNQETARTILNHLGETLLQYQTSLAPIAEEHSLTQMTNTCGIYVYEAMEIEQQKTSEQMLILLEELSTKESELTQFKKSNAPDTVHVASTFIKWGIVGGLAGGVLMVVLFFLLGIFDNRVYSPDYVSARYDIASLGGLLLSDARFDFVTKWLRKMECLLVENSADNLQFLAANVQNHCGGAREILVCSDASSTTAAALVEALQAELPDIRFTAAGSLLGDAKAVKALPNCDRVLLVFTRNHTCHKYIRKTLLQIRECGKEALGFVFIG